MGREFSLWRVWCRSLYERSGRSWDLETYHSRRLRFVDTVRFHHRPHKSIRRSIRPRRRSGVHQREIRTIALCSCRADITFRDYRIKLLQSTYGSLFYYLQSPLAFLTRLRYNESDICRKLFMWKGDTHGTAKTMQTHLH